jgi:transketolase
VKTYLLEQGKRGAALQDQWNKQLDEFTKAYPEKANSLKLCFSGKLPDGWDKDLPAFQNK